MQPQASLKTSLGWTSPDKPLSALNFIYSLSQMGPGASDHHIHPPGFDFLQGSLSAVTMTVSGSDILDSCVQVQVQVFEFGHPVF